MLASGLPSTFVPARNLVFFTYAAALGYRRGLHKLVGGMCETDYSGYPDCRDTTLRALEQAIRLGTEIPFSIETPLMWMTKADTWALTETLGGAALVDLIVEETHTCYRGERGLRHDWGYGCGACPACELRARGFAEWQDARAGDDRGFEEHRDVNCVPAGTAVAIVRRVPPSGTADLLPRRLFLEEWLLPRKRKK